MSSRSYRPPPRHDEAPRASATRRPSALFDGNFAQPDEPPIPHPPFAEPSAAFAEARRASTPPAARRGSTPPPPSSVRPPAGLASAPIARHSAQPPPFAEARPQGLASAPIARHGAQPPPFAEARPAARRAPTQQQPAPILEHAPPPSFSFGHRDENSVLFSVAALTQARHQSAPSPMDPVQATPNSFDDQPTGMVDLRAIAMNTHSSLEVKPLDVAQLRPAVVAPMPMPSLFPGAEPPAQGLAAMAKGPRAPLLYGAIALAALVFLGLGAGLTAWLLAPGDSGLTASALAPAPASEPVIVEHEVVRRSKVADASESHSTTTTATPAPRRANGNTTPRRSTPPKQTAAQKKASDPCNCKGVLACAMRCTK